MNLFQYKVMREEIDCNIDHIYADYARFKALEQEYQKAHADFRVRYGARRFERSHTITVKIADKVLVEYPTMGEVFRKAVWKFEP